MPWLIKSEELAAAAHITLRMLQYWYDIKLVDANMQKHCKLYTAEQAMLIVIIAELRHQEITLGEVQRCAPGVRAELKRNFRKLTHCSMALDPDKGTVLITPHLHTLFAAMVASRGARWCVIDIGALVGRLPQSPSADPSKAA